MRSRHLFLFGGSPPFSEKSGKQFVNLALNENSKVAILYIEREGCQEYMSKYTEVLERNGVKNFVYSLLSDNPRRDYLQEMSTCTGIIIAGGETESYRKFIVDNVLGEQLREMYNQGVPIAGFSAGALISPEQCVISPIDNTSGSQLFLDGLGLIKDIVICVHYTKWNEATNLMKAMEKTGVTTGYGINDGGYLYFENETLVEKGSASFIKLS